MTGPATDDHDALLRFVEQFALVLTESGLPRMPARVFAYVLAEDAERYTAAELAEGLRVSPAAISGAVRSLVQAGLLAREREPGSRADHYRIYDDDVWSHIIMQREPLLRRYTTVLSEGLGTLGEGRGARRIAETLDYMQFMRAELPLMIERWRKHRAEHPPPPDASEVEE
ncbi:GbsR/MarR family transcriptional regulator [Jiangella rhizosphaerae]|uniref:MarR family transcriptional regulator n=1 Tax=Jiangella rhizosphaerae TaxID=2293569 RepID=A0A418KPF0_9ACTN|nr:helix-turn-helix domain-containing protein [Jiangella rhizosphaerae]RIQ21094.1 MarR family transcriptional regulator [Jiangella rhizosphaerae]